MELDWVAGPPALPERPADGNKGTFGRVLVVGGSDEMIGAPVLAGMAALRTGAGLVQIALPKSVLAAALSICPELIGMALSGPDDTKRLVEAAGQPYEITGSRSAPASALESQSARRTAKAPRTF